MTAVAATGPVVYTDRVTGRQQTIPISSLYFSNSDGTIKADKWKPYTDGNADFKGAIDAWLGHLVKSSLLTPVERSEPKAAMVITAKDPGSTGNTIELTVSNVHESAPDVFVFDAQVKENDVYTGLTADTLKDVIGNTAGGGTKPGLVFVSSAGAPGVPKAGNYPLTGDPAEVEVKKADDTTAFKLKAKAAGADGARTVVTIGAPDANDKFTLTAKWERSETNLAPADLQTKFAYELTVTAPDGSPLAVPGAGTTVLAGGADKADAIRAKATVPGRA